MSAAMPSEKCSTSFQKKSRVKSLQIQGARPSLHNNQLLVSTGIPSLDNIIGGGIAVGTVLLVEEDSFGSYSRLMLKYFLAEGVLSQHALFLASADLSPGQLLKELPGPLIDDPGLDPQPSAGSSDSMKIAWRYQHMPQQQVFMSSPSAVRFGHYYDLTKPMDPALIELVQKTLHEVSLGEPSQDGSCNIMNPAYAKLLTDIKTTVDKGEFSTTASPQQRNILRIGVHSLGSPQWDEGSDNSLRRNTPDPSLPRFLLALRALMRSAFAVCILTIPTHLLQDSVLVHRIEHLSDYVVCLDAFTGSNRETNPAYKEYHGLFKLVKLPRLNSLVSHMPDTLDLAFKLRRKKFVIEKLHLPPELSETTSRDQEDPVKLLNPGSTGCGSFLGKSKLDF